MTSITGDLTLISISSQHAVDHCSITSELAQHHRHWHLAAYHGKHLQYYDDVEKTAAKNTAKTWLAVGYSEQDYPSAAADRGPFSRELWGRHWLMAAGGKIPRFTPRIGSYEAIGESFQEALLCDCLNQVRQNLPRDVMPQQLAELLADISLEYHQAGLVNFFLTNGEWLFISSAQSLTKKTLKTGCRTPQVTGVIIGNHLGAASTDSKDKYHLGDWCLWQTGELVAAGSRAI